MMATTRGYRWVVVALLALAFAPVPALAQDLLAGQWKIASSEPAPWKHEPGWEVPAEIRQLVGAKVVLKASRIDGPKQLACQGPHYQVKPYGADMLFQGTLEEKGDAKNTPEKVATALGFSKRPIPTLTTGCANEIEFHVIDQEHMLFGLNNRVYRMVRTDAPAASAASPAASPASAKP